VPLRPGDSVRIRITILDSRVSRSKPDRGTVRGRGQLINQNDQDVLRLDLVNIFPPPVALAAQRASPAHDGNTVRNCGQPGKPHVLAGIRTNGTNISAEPNIVYTFCITQ
jgi:hypothetical protein